MMANSSVIRDKDMESSNGRMAVFTRDSGLMVSSMAVALSSKLMAPAKLVFGRMARIFSGLMTCREPKPRVFE